MKTTSLIFLAFSLILLIGGFIICGVAKTMAASNDIKIYEQEKNDAGDYVYTYNISDSAVRKLELKFKDVDVNIIGTEKESYIELINFNANSYKTTLSSDTVTVDGNVGFLSSLIDMSDGGLKFKGLRYLLLDKPDPDRERAVNIYVSKASEIISLSVSSTNGDIICSNLTNDIVYTMSANSCNIDISGLKSEATMSLDVAEGNVTVKESEFNTLSVSIDNGNLSVDAEDAYSPDLTAYNLTATEGSLTYNGAAVEGPLKVTPTAAKWVINATVNKGSITVNDGAKNQVTE